jgi:hypothetical protein
MVRNRNKPTDPNDSTLASFRIRAGDWYEFGLLCDQHGISASEAIKSYIQFAMRSGTVSIDDCQKCQDINPNSNLDKKVVQLERTLDDVVKRLDAIEQPPGKSIAA